MAQRFVVQRSPGRILVTWPKFVRIVGLLFLIGGIALVTLAITRFGRDNQPFLMSLIIGLFFVPVGYAMCCNVFRLEMSESSPRYALRYGVFPFTHHHAGQRAESHIEVARSTRRVGSKRNRRTIPVVEVVIVLPDPPQRRVEVALANAERDPIHAYETALSHAKQMCANLQLRLIDRAALA